MLPGLVVVVSPLLALMADQLQSLCPSLKRRAAQLNSNTPKKEVNQILARLKGNRGSAGANEADLAILFVSPERFTADSFLHLLGEGARVSLVCVDEAHCVSEWSHNFRTSYLRIKKCMQQHLSAHVRLLALTASATGPTAQSICHEFSIANPRDVIRRSNAVRPNLLVSCSNDMDKHKALLRLLAAPAFASSQSVLVYCLFRRHVDELVRFLSVHGVDAVGYHAGMLPDDRQNVQARFMSGKVRVLVATIAFGLGLDKADIRAVIHFHMPKSLENYTQEIGRAGRDGLNARCHVFLSDEDYATLRALAHCHYVDERTVHLFLNEVLPENCEFVNQRCVLGVNDMELTVDVSESVLNTMFSLLEKKGLINVMETDYGACEFSCLKVPVDVLKERSPLIKAALPLSRMPKRGVRMFSLNKVAQSLEVTVDQIVHALHGLKKMGFIRFKLVGKAFQYKKLQAVKAEHRFLLASEICNKMNELECCKIKKVDETFSIMKRTAFISWQLAGSAEFTGNPELVQLVNEYFSDKGTSVDRTSHDRHAGVVDGQSTGGTAQSPSGRPAQMLSPVSKLDTRFAQQQAAWLRSDIKAFLIAHDNISSGVTVARIFYGIPSPAYSAVYWAQNSMWGRHRRIDFAVIVKEANELLVELKQRMSVAEAGTRHLQQQHQEQQEQQQQQQQPAAASTSQQPGNEEVQENNIQIASGE